MGAWRGGRTRAGVSVAVQLLGGKPEPMAETATTMAARSAKSSAGSGRLLPMRSMRSRSVLDRGGVDAGVAMKTSG